jgi:predicted TIM-barrel fold metal-dependent hydrolase
MVIDFHAHIYPDALADKVISGIEDFYGVKRTHNAVLSDLLASLEKGDVDKAVVLPIATKPEHAKLNEWYASLAKRSDRIIPFGGIHPDNDLSELEKFPSLGLKGLKIQPNALRVFPSDERFQKFYDKAIELGLVVVFHAGDEESGFKGEFSQPKDFVPVLDAHPDLTIVLSHLGGFRTWDHLDLVLGYPNVYFDTAHVPGKVSDDEVLRLVEKIGLDKVIYGSDYPFADHTEDRKAIEGIFKDDASVVYSTNPSRLLGM